MSKSSSKSNSTQSSSSLQQDNKIAADGGATAISGTGGNVTVNQSDMGLISAAFDYFKGKDAYAAAAQQEIIGVAKSGFESIMGAGEKFLSVAATAADPAAQQSRMEMMLLGVAALFLLTNFKGAK